MNLRVNFDLAYELDNPATFLFALKCLQTGGQKVISELLVTNPTVEVEDFHVVSGMNRFSRLLTHHPGLLEISYEAEVSISHRIVDVDDIRYNPMSNLNPEGIPFLFPSRYCQSDIMRQCAHVMFGHIKGPYEIATAVSNWIYENVSYVLGSSGEMSSALDTMNRREGVCRDFAHLGITLCRSLNVPARYVTMYAHDLDPPDFHACFEVFIGGWWYIFDATRLAPLNGLVRIATGRDAADAAVCTIFGNPVLTKSEVGCEVLDPDFEPVTRDSLMDANQAIVLL